MRGLQLLNNHLASVGELLLSKLPSVPFNYETPETVKSMVIHPTDHSEVSTSRERPHNVYRTQIVLNMQPRYCENVIKFTVLENTQRDTP